jgi:large conductance mechanosensitive channel
VIKLLAGFKDFIMRGNVVDLAVGIVIGAAFTGLVDNFTAAFIKPALQLFGADSENQEPGGDFHVLGVSFPWSTFVNGLVAFLITAAVLYFLVVLPMNKLAERRKKGKEPEAAALSEEIILLTEIRDALVGAAVPRQRATKADVE